MSFVRMKPPAGVTYALGADDKSYYVDEKGYANVDGGSVTKLTNEGWVRADYVAPPTSPAYSPVMGGVDPVTGGIKTIAVLTQAQYDALPVKDPNTEYNIVAA